MPKLKTPNCTYCGKVWAPEHSPGWQTNMGPGKFKDSTCYDCKEKSWAAWDKALNAHHREALGLKEKKKRKESIKANEPRKPNRSTKQTSWYYATQA